MLAGIMTCTACARRRAALKRYARIAYERAARLLARVKRP